MARLSPTTPSVRGFATTQQRATAAATPTQRCAVQMALRRTVSCRVSSGTASNVLPWPDDINRPLPRRVGTPQPIKSEEELRDTYAHAQQTDRWNTPRSEAPDSARSERRARRKARQAVISTLPYSHTRYFGWMVFPPSK